MCRDPREAPTQDGDSLPSHSPATQGHWFLFFPALTDTNSLSGCAASSVGGFISASRGKTLAHTCAEHVLTPALPSRLGRERRCRAQLPDPDFVGMSTAGSGHRWKGWERGLALQAASVASVHVCSKLPLLPECAGVFRTAWLRRWAQITNTESQEHMYTAPLSETRAPPLLPEKVPPRMRSLRRDS